MIKNNKAFTLIELLAVIVILAIIALIAVPNVLNIIEDSRKSSLEASARNIAKVAENYYAQHALLHNEKVGEIDLTGNILNYNGKKPYKGYVYFDDDGNAYIKMYQDGYCIVGDYDNTTEAIKMEAEECEIKSLIIFIDLDGGTLEDTYLEYEQGDTYGELPIPTKEGYTFIGWFDKNDNEITPDTVIDKSSTIYAKWEANAYTVTLSISNASIPQIDGWDLVNGIPTKIVTYDTKYGILPEPEKEGYTFEGWYTAGGFKIISESILKIANDHTLTGSFTPNNYEVTFKYNNSESDTVKEVTYDNAYGDLPTPNRIGYEFLGWYSGNTKVEGTTIVKITGEQILEARYSANTYEVTFKYNNGLADTTKEVTFDSTYGILPTPSKTGYIFQGWFTTGGSTITSESKVTIASNHILTALWSASGYTLTYNANGGTVTPGNKSITYDSTYGDLPTPTREGYIFSGWYTSSSGGTKVTSSTKITVADNHSIYAQWNPITYIVVYNANGGTGSMSSVTHTYDESKNLTSNAFTKNGYTFAGWATSSSGNVVYSNNASVTNLSSINGTTINLYAKWNPITYIVAYNANGGSGSMTSVSHTYDAAKALTANTFTRTGYDFAGWATSSAGSVAYANGASVKNLSSTSGATVTLYAKWMAKTFTVTFDANGGTTSTTSKIVAYDSTYGDLPIPSRTGYTFNGWFTSTSGGTQISASTTVSITSNQTLYAQWKIESTDKISAYNSSNIYYIKDGNLMYRYASGSWYTSTIATGGVTAVHVVDGSNIYYVQNGNLMYRYASGSWYTTTVATGGVTSVHAINNSNIYYVQNGNLMYRYASGSWYTTTVATGGVTSVHAIDSSNIYYVQNGNLMYRYASGSWYTSTITTGGVTEVHAIDSSNIYYVQNNNLMYRYASGSWYTSTITTGGVTSVYVADSSNIYYIQNNNLMYRYASGSWYTSTITTGGVTEVYAVNSSNIYYIQNNNLMYRYASGSWYTSTIDTGL